MLVRSIRVSIARRCTSSETIVAMYCFCCTRSVAVVSSWRHECSRTRLSDRMNNSPPAITWVCGTPAAIYPMPTRIAERLTSRSASYKAKADCYTASKASCTASVAVWNSVMRISGSGSDGGLGYLVI